MNVRGKVTPKMRRRVLELRGAGVSLRGIQAKLLEEGIELSHIAVRDLCNVAKVAKGAGVRTGGGADEDESGGEGGGAEGERDGGEGEEEPGEVRGAREEVLTAPIPELPDDASVAARACWEDLKEVRQIAAELRPAVKSGDYSATQWATLKNVALRLMGELHKMLPPPKADPSKDPTNIAARAMVHAHVLQSIEAAEARIGLLCPRCRGEVGKR